MGGEKDGGGFNRDFDVVEFVLRKAKRAGIGEGEEREREGRGGKEAKRQQAQKGRRTGGGEANLMRVDRVANDHVQHAAEVERQGDGPVDVSGRGGPAEEDSPVEGEACDKRRKKVSREDASRREKGTDQGRAEASE